MLTGSQRAIQRAEDAIRERVEVLGVQAGVEEEAAQFRRGGESHKVCFCLCSFFVFCLVYNIGFFFLVCVEGAWGLGLPPMLLRQLREAPHLQPLWRVSRLAERRSAV